MKNFILVLSILGLCASCRKDSASKNTASTSTTYVTLGRTDSTGKPLYLTTPDVISPELTQFVQSNFPEFVNFGIAHPALLSTTTIADIVVTQTSSVSVTFVSEGTSSTDAIGFYTYQTSSPPATTSAIKTITYIFPNAGGNTTLKPGDKVNIGTVQAGYSIGFILFKNGWDPLTKGNNNNVLHFWSNDAFNPEADPTLKKHAVVLNYPDENINLIGFEDENRTDQYADNDFNDIVFYTTLKAL
jgi:hypothetical protein